MPLLKLPFVKMMGIVLQMLLLIGLCLASEYAIGQTDLPDPPSPPRIVNDFAGLLKPDEAASLENKLVQYSDCTSNQVCIVTVEALGEYEVADFAQRLGHKWGIGKKDRNNGVLILISKTDRKMTIQTGFGLEGVLPDHICARIIEDNLKPNFKEGDYYQGLEEATNEIIERTRAEFMTQPPVDQQEVKDIIISGLEKEEDDSGFEIPWGVILIVLVILYFIGSRKDSKLAFLKTWNPIFWLISLIIYLFSASSYTRGNNSNRYDNNSRSGSSSDSGGSSSGFSGFGGGDFGGGGASGSW